MSAYEVVRALAPADRAHLHNLLQGVPHVGSARVRFNGWCHDHGVLPNEVLALFRGIDQGAWSKTLRAEPCRVCGEPAQLVRDGWVCHAHSAINTAADIDPTNADELLHEAHATDTDAPS